MQYHIYIYGIAVLFFILIFVTDCACSTNEHHIFSIGTEKKFEKKGRTISSTLTQGYNESLSNGSQYTDQLFYTYEKEKKKVGQRKINIQYVENGIIKSKAFDTYFTHHGPIMGMEKGKWLSLQENNRSLNALLECWTRTKAKNLKEYKTALNLLANNSNNTVYADADGNIAYWHGNFMPKRNPKYDYTLPVDGSVAATNWTGVHNLSEIVQSINPVNGWLQNCNATPYAVAGINSPRPEQYPAYMAPDGQNGRGINAIQLLEKIDKINLDELIALGYNKHLSAFDILLPSFISFTKTISLTEAQRKAIQYLENWNHDAAENSIATTLAIE